MKNKLFNLALLIGIFAIFSSNFFAQADQKAELVVRTGHTSYTSSVVFSPDGKIIASNDGDSNIILWDAASGQELRHIQAFGSWENGLAFSPDGKKLMSAGFWALPRIWEVETGNELPPISDEFEFFDDELEGHGKWKNIRQRAGSTFNDYDPKAYGSWKAVFSPDGKFAASANYDKTLWLFDLAARKIVRIFRGHTNYVRAIAYSPDGKTLVSGDDSGAVKVWDTATGNEIRQLNGNNGEVKAVVFSPDGKLIATAGGQGVKIWDAASGNMLRSLTDDSGIQSIQFSPDGKSLISSGYTLKLWNVANGKDLVNFGNLSHTEITSVAFSPDGKTIVIAKKQGKSIALYDTANGREIRDFTGHADAVNYVRFSKDGKSIAASSGAGGSIGSSSKYGHRLKIWNTETTPVLQVFPIEHGSKIENGFPTDFVAQKEKDRYSADFGNIFDEFSSFSEFGNFKIQRTVYSTLALLDKRTDKLLATLISLDENDWAVVTPNGLFDASPEGRKLMHFIVGLETVSLEQMKDVYYVPGLLRKIFAGEPLPNVQLFSKKDLFPTVEFTPPTAGQKELTVKVTNRGGGIGKMQVLVNGKEFIADARPAGFNPNAKDATIKISLKDAPLFAEGDNRIEVIAANASGSINNRGTARSGLAVKEILKDNASKETPHIYIIAAGVSDYTGENLDLNFAAKDAEDFARAAELGAIKLIGDKSKVHIRLLTGGGAAEKTPFASPDSKIGKATKQEIMQAFTDFSKATPSDLFIVYLAGHGISLNLSNNPNQAGGDTYLYLTQEATTTDSSVLSVKETREAMTVSSETLKELMKQNKALKQVLVLDTCASGQAAESFVAKRNLPSDQIRAIERLKDNTGFYILMGSAANAVSYEASQFGQGLLTYSLLQGMKGVALDNNDANVGKLFEYAVKTVPEMAKNIGGVQQPRIITPDQSRDFPIGRFTSAEQGKISLANPKPLILNPNLFNPSAKRDDLKLSKMMAEQLRAVNFAASRDGQTSFVFVEADEMSGAFEPSGTYTVTGDILKISMILTKSGKQIGNEITVEGKVGEKENLIKTLVSKIVETAK